MLPNQEEGGTGERVGRCGRGRGPMRSNDEHVDKLNGQRNDQGLGAIRNVEGVNGNVEGVNGGVGNQGNVRNQNGNVVNENVQENVRNVFVNGNQVGCSYKEFLACNPKEYDGNGGVVVLTRWVEKMESVQDMIGYSIGQKVKYTAGSFVGKALTCHEMQKLETKLWNHIMVGTGHATYTDRFHELARLVPHLLTPESRKIERYMYGLAPQIRGMVAETEPKTMQKAVQISSALIDEAVRNRSNKKVEKKGNVGEPSKDKNGRDDNKRTMAKNAFATTANPVERENTGAWPKCTTCNSYHAPKGPCRTCFNYNHPGHFAKDCKVVPRNVNPINVRSPTPARGACHKCGSTDHLKPGRGNQGNQARGRAFMLGAEEARQDPNIVTCIKPSELGFRYEIEIASEQLVEIDKVIKGCKLEIEEEKVRLLMSTKTRDKKQEGIAVVRYFPEVFLDDLSGLPPLWKIEFQIELISGAVLIAKSPYRLVPFELEELSRQLKELQDKDPSKIEVVKNWKAPRTPSDGEEQENAFQTLKDKLCNAPVLALPDRPKDFVVYYDASELGLGYVLMQRGGVVADALSRKEIIKPKRVRSINMTLQSSIKDRILVAQKQVVDESARLQKGLDEKIEQRSDGTLYYLDQIWVPLKGDVRTLIIDEAHKSKYYVHPGADKMYYDLRDRYLWPGMKKDIANVRCAPFEALYGRKCRSPIMWGEVGVGQLIGPELVQETTEKISQIKDRLKAARDRQKSYADKMRKPLEFSVVGPVAYRLDLPEELDGVHDTFYVSNLKKCLVDPTLQVPLDEIQVDAKLNFVEEPMEILKKEFKKLKQSRIAIVKVRWDSKRGPKFTWEHED
ncbi:putative reverse transcriptase domain-containing protein [Tanacetum coccineum]